MTGILAQATGGFAKLASDASVFLIVGGLCMLGLVVLLVVLRTIFPSGKPGAGGMLVGPLPRHLENTASLGETPGTRTPTPLDARKLESGARVAFGMRPRSLDEVFDHVTNQRWGVVRLLRLRDDHAVVRYYDCRDCREAQAVGAVHEGCSFQAGFLRGAFLALRNKDVHVQELSCRRRGQPACEFEVRFA